MIGKMMGAMIRARYEDKVLKPLRELNLKEGDEVEISASRGAPQVESLGSGSAGKG